MAQLNVSGLLATIRSLPPLPAGISRLLALDQGTPSYLEQASGIIRTDPALVAQIIKIANSAIYTGQDPVDTLERALLRVGVRTAVNALVSAHLQRVFNPSDQRLSALWLSNLLAGILCRSIAEENAELDIIPEAAYTYGLLHDVGRLVLMHLEPDASESLLASDPHPVHELAGAEADALNFDHQLAGRLLGNSWKFPQGLTLVIATHHAPQQKRDGHSPFVESMINLVNLADCVGRAVRDTASGEDDLEARAAVHLEDEGASRLMDNLALSRKGILSTIKPSFEELDVHARSMGISLEESFTKLGV